jgi:gliding motility associated protien GldN
MNLSVKNIVLATAVAAFSVDAFGQYDPEASVNPNSLFNIPVYEQVYKVRVWRDLLLKEKQNKGFYARGNEMTKILIDAIRSGEIPKVYKSDSLSENSVFTKAEFFLSMQLQAAQVFPAWDQNSNYITTDRVSYNGLDYEATQDNVGQVPDAPTSIDYWQTTSAGKASEFQVTDMYKLELMEDIIFDKRRSRLYYDIQAVRIWAWDENGQFFKPLGWLKYKDMERVFRAHPEKAIWFNRQNTAQNRNLADAFLLRLFHASIKEVENPDHLELNQIYNLDYQQSVMAREWEEMKLMEKEHNLWEY